MFPWDTISILAVLIVLAYFILRYIIVPIIEYFGFVYKEVQPKSALGKIATGFFSVLFGLFVLYLLFFISGNPFMPFFLNPLGFIVSLVVIVPIMLLVSVAINVGKARARARLEAGEKIQPKPEDMELNKLIGEGNVLSAEKNFEEAERKYRKALELSPNDPFLIYTVGEFYRKKRDIAKSEREFRKIFPEYDASKHTIKLSWDAMQDRVFYIRRGAILYKKIKVKKKGKAYKLKIEKPP